MTESLYEMCPDNRVVVAAQARTTSPRGNKQSEFSARTWTSAVKIVNDRDSIGIKC